MFKFEHVKYKDIIDIDNLNINLGEVTCIIGPSGSGKSTCLRLINKLISPTTGIISLNGENIANINSVEYRRKVPMLSQSPVSFPGSIRDNLLMGRKFQGKNEVSNSDLQNALDKVSLDEPSSALDDITEDFVIKSMVDMAKSQNKTIIYVTHSNSMAEKYSDRVIKIVDGIVNNG